MSLSFNLSLPTVRESTHVKCTAPEDVLRELADIQTAAQECFVAITLNTQNRIIDKHIVTIGTLNASLAHPREVFRPAITDAADSIIIAHNHPSGDPTPSAEDIRTTKQLINAGEILGIRVLDHIIIGRKSGDKENHYTSLRETGIVKFS